VFQFCPPCEEINIRSYDGRPLPEGFAFLLKVTLPEVHFGADTASIDGDQPNNQIGSQEEETKEVVQRLQGLDERLEVLETRFQGVESKLDQIMSILAATNVGG